MKYLCDVAGSVQCVSDLTV